MKRINVCMYTVLVITLLTVGCATTKQPVFESDLEGTPTPWTHEMFKNDPDEFQFVIVSDNAGYIREGVFDKAVERLNWMQPEFVMCVGDLIEGYRKKNEDVQGMWDCFEGIIANLEAPFFHVPGNHDKSNEVMGEIWKERFGSSYYYFVYKNVLFMVVDTEDPPLAQDVALKPDISPEQVAYFTKVLNEHPEVRWTCVFLHEPCWTPEVYPGWAAIEEQLNERPYTVFSGHWHHYTTYERNGREYYVLATTGGDSALGGPAVGEFDHFMWVTMTAEGPKIANLLLDGILGTDGGRDSGSMSPALIDQKLHSACTPILFDTKEFRIAETEITLKNDAKIPVTVAVEFVQHPSLAAVPKQFNTVLEPGGKMSRPVIIQCANSKHDSIDTPLIARITFSCEIPGQPGTTVFTRMEKIQPVQLQQVEKAMNPVTVDGKLNDWASLPIRCHAPAQVNPNPENWYGTEDAAFRFGLCHDADFLYIAVEVKDDDAYYVKGEQPWVQDGVEIRIDARPDPARSLGTGEKEFDDFLVISIVPGQNQTQIYQHDKLPEGLQAVSVATATGHITEAAIPVAYLNDKQGKAWEYLRVNVAVDDFDHGKDNILDSQLWWCPDWRKPDNYSGSGTFIKK